MHFWIFHCEGNPLFQRPVLCDTDQTSSNKRQVDFTTLWPPAVNVLSPHLRSVTALDLGPPLPTAYYFVLPEGQLAISAASNSLAFAKLSQWNEPVGKKIITLIKEAVISNTSSFCRTGSINDILESDPKACWALNKNKSPLTPITLHLFFMFYYLFSPFPPPSFMSGCRICSA